MQIDVVRQMIEGAAVDEPDQGSVGDVAYARIRNDILEGALEPGMKLKLDLLKRTYEVSINTLRETLARLASEGLVEAEGQKGFRVVPISIADLREIGELRQLIECHAVRTSIENGDLEWEGRIVAAHHMLAHIEQLMLKEGLRHVLDWQRFDREYHVALMSACNSRWILRVHRAIHDQYRRYQLVALKSVAFRGEESVRDHRSLLDLALKREAEGAVRLLARHIQVGTVGRFEALARA